MPQPRKAGRFGGSPAHHKMMVANLATELIRHGRITTTVARAKTVQPVAERMITFAKRGDLHARRQVLRVIRDRDVVHKLFADVGPAFAERQGGYTRVLKLGARKGDAAPMALIELVEGVSVAGDGDLAEQPRRRWSLRRRRGGTLSATAREQAEERQAAVDRGEGDEDLYDEYDEGDVEAVDDESDDEGVQADPAEVEARLAEEVEDVVTDPELDDSEKVAMVEDIVEDELDEREASADQRDGGDERGNPA